MVAAKFLLVGAVLVAIVVAISVISLVAEFGYKDEPTATAGGSIDGSETDSFFEVIKKVSRRSLMNIWSKPPVEKKMCASLVREKEVRMLKDKVARQHRLIENLTTERLKLQKYIEDCDMKNSHKLQRCDELEKLNEKINQSLTECIGETRAHRDSIHNQTRDFGILNNTLNEQKIQCDKDKRELQATINDTNGNLTECTSQTNSQKDSIRNLDRKIKNLDRNLTKCIDETRANGDLIHNQTRDYRILNNNLIQCDKDKRELQATINDTNGNLTECTSQTNSLKDSIRNQTQDYRILNITLIQCDKDKRELQATINDTNGNLTECTNQTNSQKDSIHNLTRTIADMDSKIESLRKSIDTYITENNKTSANLVKCNDSKIKCKHAAKQLSETIIEFKRNQTERVVGNGTLTLNYCIDKVPDRSVFPHLTKKITNLITEVTYWKEHKNSCDQIIEKCQNFTISSC